MKVFITDFCFSRKQKEKKYRNTLYKIIIFGNKNSASMFLKYIFLIIFSYFLYYIFLKIII